MSNPRGRPRREPQARFWQQVIKTDSCWLLPNGRYSKIKLQPPMKPTVSGHRFSWEIHFGEVPEGMQVCHRCNNKQCVRPDHLYLATCKENIRDAIRDGLKPRWIGSLNPRSRLTVDAVRRIRLAVSRSTRSLAHQFGVSTDSIQRIRSGRAWASVR